MTSNSAPLAADSSVMDAYLVLHRGVRWTDVYRLSAPQDVLLGRSSDNQVVLRSARASRRHARLVFQEGDWVVEDLASRNGVFVNQQRIEQPQPLQEGDRLQVAGFEMRFTHDLARWSGPGLVQPSDLAGQDLEHQATQDDIELGDDPHWENESEWLDIISRPASISPTASIGSVPGQDQTPTALPSTTALPSSTAHPSTDQSLLQMAFALGRLECPLGDLDPASALLLQALAAQIPAAEIGLYVFDGERELPMPRHVRQREGRRYRRPPESLVRQIRAPGAPALLARNVVGDRNLASADTRGEIDVESIILVPLHLPTVDQPEPPSGSRPANGLLHVITTAGDRSLDERDLTLAVTAGEIFCEACRTLQQRSELQQTLHRSREIIGSLRKQLAGRVEILGKSDAIAEVQVQIAQVARSSAAVLLRGESGTGKELVASAIHFASPRADEPMICLNCAALSKDLLESELFGHEKGAFTGATEQKKGKFEAASGGTLMLDEIGEMNLELQSKLLRVLEGHPFERVGGHTPVRVDVRVIAATHRDLQGMVGAGTFRQDLFYRLNVIELVVPPLRQRGRDVLLLAAHFVTSFVHAMGRGPMKLTPQAQQKLIGYSWPGNVRELRNVIERAVVMAPLDARAMHEIGPDELLLTRAVHADTPTPAAPPPLSTQANTAAPVSLAHLERQHIEEVLRSTGGNKSKASTILGIERSTLDRKLKRFAEADVSD